MMIKRDGAEVQTQPQTGSSPSKEGSRATPLGCQDTLMIKHQSASRLMDQCWMCDSETGHSHVTLGKLLYPLSFKFLHLKKKRNNENYVAEYSESSMSPWGQGKQNKC